MTACKHSEQDRLQWRSYTIFKMFSELGQYGLAGISRDFLIPVK